MTVHDRILAIGQLSINIPWRFSWDISLIMITFKQFLIEARLPTVADVVTGKVYGGWIHPSGDYVSAKSFDHITPIIKNPKRFGISLLNKVPWADIFDNGWVRIVWNAFGTPRVSSAIEGQAKSIKSVWSRVGLKIIKSGEGHCEIDVVIPGTEDIKGYKFILPQERKQLVDFIHSL